MTLQPPNAPRRRPQSFINNADAIAKLRSTVLSQMASARGGGGGGSGGADAGAAASSSDQGDLKLGGGGRGRGGGEKRQVRASPRGGASGRGGGAAAFDSDDYSDERSDGEGDDVAAADRMARAAAARLDAESVGYIQHHLPRGGRGGGGGGGGSGGGDPDGRQARDSRGGGGRDGRGGRGGRGGGRGGRGGTGGVPQPTVGGKAPARLRGDTAIGNVVEAAGGMAVAVLREGKSRLFEAGSPMVRLARRAAGCAGACCACRWVGRKKRRR